MGEAPAETGAGLQGSRAPIPGAEGPEVASVKTHFCLLGALPRPSPQNQAQKGQNQREHCREGTGLG